MSRKHAVRVAAVALQDIPYGVRNPVDVALVPAALALVCLQHRRRSVPVAAALGLGWFRGVFGNGQVRRAMYDELSHQRRRGLLRPPGELLQVWREQRATACSSRFTVWR